ncbi:MAG: nucleoside-diphosphate kinase [Acidimicrobiia bacterium]|nr:nucleoside-diphosphate kinase [Acidimicrobiia bacterium]
MTDKTFLILKPDAVKRKLTGEIITRIERKNLSITKMEMRVLDHETLEEHYVEHKGKPFFEGMVDFMASGPVVILQVEGREAQKVMRTLIGTTDPAGAEPGTIRGDLGIEFSENLIHGSDSPESAEREIGIFFK